MVRIDHFSVKGFKNIADADVSFNNFNVIIGPNNSGKSNFLQIFSFLDLIINGAADEVERYFKIGFYGSVIGDPIPRDTKTVGVLDFDGKMEFAMRFSNSETHTTFQYRLILGYEGNGMSDPHFGINSEFLESKENGKPGKAVTIFERGRRVVKYGSSVPKIGVNELAAHLSVIKLLKLFSNNSKYTDALNSLSKVIKTPIFYFSNIELLKAEAADRLTVFKGRTIAFDLEQEIISIQDNDKWEIFKAAIKDVLNIDDVQVYIYVPSRDSAPNKMDVVFKQFNVRKTANQFSDGSILILALITKVLNSEHDIFFIEEPENSTHPKALVDLIGFLQSFSENKQFVITSHSIPILNKTKIDDIITSVINKKGFTEIRNVKDQKELKSRLKSGHVNFSDELFFADDNEEFE